MSEWTLEADPAPCEDMVLYRGAEVLLNDFKNERIGYSVFIDNVANYFRQKEKEIREEERKNVIGSLVGKIKSLEQYGLFTDEDGRPHNPLISQEEVLGIIDTRC